jgi:diphthine-ammonia ligase
MARFVSLYTGGKDSHTATLIAMREFKAEPALLLIIVTPKEDSYLLHTVNVKWAYIHGHVMGIPTKLVEISGSDEEGEVLRELEKAVEQTNASMIVTGGIASMYQKKRFDSMARDLGVEHVSPLWGMDQERVLKLEVLEYGVSFMIVAAMAMGFTEEWVGRVIDDKEDVEQLLKLSRKYMFSPVGEGGEYESYVVYSPLFRCTKLIPIGRRVWFPSGWGLYIIENVEKNTSNAECRGSISFYHNDTAMLNTQA